MPFILDARYADLLKQVVRNKGSGVHSLRREAASCRETAKQFVGRPEAPFLLRMASAFDELALIDATKRSLRV